MMEYQFSKQVQKALTVSTDHQRVCALKDQGPADSTGVGCPHGCVPW